jgi:hypothetical protein
MHIPGLPSSLHYGNLVNRACPLNRGLVSWWLTLPLGGKGATWFDIASKNHGTLTNGPTWSGALGRQGGCGAINLDGSDDSVTGAAFGTAITAPLTISCWAYVRTSTAVICGIRDSAGDDHWSLMKDTGIGSWAVRFVANDRFTASAISGSNTGDFNQWVHLVGVSSASNNHLIYVNTIAGTADTTDVTPDSVTTPYIGTGGGIIGTTIDGMVDDFRVYNRALSASEVRAIYNDSRQGYPQTLNRIRPVRLGTAAVGGTAARARFYALLNVA